MTQLSFEPPGDHLFVKSVGENGIRIGERCYTRSLILRRDRVVDDWPPQSIEAFEERHFEVLLEMKPEVVLLGTGSRQRFLSPEQQMTFYRRQIGIEVMTTQAACRTFNVLASEHRDVVAALLPLAA